VNIEVKPYFAVGERYPSLIGVRADGDEYETAYVSKRELVDVLDENAKLRQQLADVTESMGRVEERCAKLRELVRDLWSVMWACAEQRCQHRHDDCFMVNGNGDGPKDHGKCWYEHRMRELGVEVN
jgi:hypothetical protein